MKKYISYNSLLAFEELSPDYYYCLSNFRFEQFKKEFDYFIYVSDRLINHFSIHISSNKIYHLAYYYHTDNFIDYSLLVRNGFAKEHITILNIIRVFRRIK